MTKYILKRLLHGLISVVIVVIIVMLLVYSLMDRENIFAKDPLYTKKANNEQTVYRYTQWEKFGYLDYYSYTDYLNELVKEGTIDETVKANVMKIGKDPSADSSATAEYVAKFSDYCESKGYTVVRLNAVLISTKSGRVDNGGTQALFAYKDNSLFKRAINFFTGIVTVDNIHYVDEETDIGERKLTFTLHDPLAGGKFAPAIMGNGTLHKYLLYFDGEFPYIHQNLFTVKLGTSFVVNKGIDVFDTMNDVQGAQMKRTVTYPTGYVIEKDPNVPGSGSADNLHTVIYAPGSRDALELYQTQYTDDYTNAKLFKQNMSTVGYSFVIGIISTILAYALGIPLGVVMARKKDKLIDKIGTVYIIFILAVPSLAYIFLFKAIGRSMGLPGSFTMDKENVAMYVLPVVSLALPSVAGFMKWIRRYMIDQMNSDYVKFARSGGLTDREIFSKHILKNAIIPIVHGIPGSVLGALTGAIITERVYAVPGTGNLLTTAINTYDNAVIIGVTLFYSLLSVVSLILGDVLMAMVDPRISFTTGKAR